MLLVCFLVNSSILWQLSLQFIHWATLSWRVNANERSPNH